MDLLLWRPGDEAHHKDDAKRPLSLRGASQARAIAGWLRRHAPGELRVLVSPARAARDCAEILAAPFERCAQIGPQAGAADLLAASGWPVGTGKRHAGVLLLAHQPALGALAALLLAGREDAWTIKKGALWWFSNRVRTGETQTVLRAVIAPDLAGDD